MYSYWHERGLSCILASRILSLSTLAFTISLFIFVVEVLDWHAVVHECASEESCLQIRLLRPDAFSSGSLFRILYYYALFTLYWVWSLVHLSLIHI